jgi:ribosome-associated protein
MPLSLQDLQNVVIDALEDIKGQNILVFDAQPLTSMFDRVIVVSGTSNRQTRALAKNLHDKVKQAGGDVTGAEGEETGEWVLVDLGDIIVHIMQPAIRDYYRLEEIWGKHPIDWQAERKLAVQKAAPRRKPTAKKPLSEKTPAKKSPAKKDPAKKSPAKKPAAKGAAAKKPKK